MRLGSLSGLAKTLENLGSTRGRIERTKISLP
jgi:hypothetical protein